MVPSHGTDVGSIPTLPTKFMKVSDIKKIKTLMNDGYRVVIRDLDGKSFGNRYLIFQDLGFSELKRVLVDAKGNVIGLQG